jgi:6-phospho-beta-glucosidase
VAIGVQRTCARLLAVEPEQVVVDQVGLNHLTWVRAVRVDGLDVLPRLLDEHGDELAGLSGLPLRVSEELGVLPSYYLRYFYAHDRVLAEQLGGTPRAVEVMEIERGLLDLYRDPGLREKPALLEQRGGAFYSEAAVGLVRSLATGDGAVHEVDVRNAGTLQGFADDDVVEVPARVTRDSIEPLAQEPLPPELLGLAQHVAAYERLAAEASATQDLELARKALLAHPLIGQHNLADELLEPLLAPWEARV